MKEPVKLLEDLRRNREDIAAAAGLDTAGFLLGAGESVDEYIQRCSQLLTEAERLIRRTGEGKTVLAPGVKVGKRDRIPAGVVAEAGDITEELYRFRIDWAPGFFVNERMGFLWGGCSWYDPESGALTYIVRSAFRDRAKWGIYERGELIAHELCHAAHTPLAFDQLEEFFAYQTGKKPFRRYMGNCFIRGYDAFVFITPPFLVLAIQLMNIFMRWSVPIWPFWGLGAVVVLWFLVRNQLARNRFFRAARALSVGGVDAVNAVLFRCTNDEITEIGRLKRGGFNDYLDAKCAEALRWRVIRHRFVEANKHEA